MNILKAIGGLFVRLWRWIKETAWIHPLLIVGAIFAVIFSIPKFTEWVSAINVASASRYWSDYKLTINNETASTNDYNTAADKLTQSINEWSNFSGEYHTYEEWDAGMKAKLADKKLSVNIDPRTEYGEKFFLVYVSEDCANCDAIQPAFETLKEYWNTNYKIEGSAPYKIHTIFADESSDNDEQYTIPSEKKAFVRYLNKFNDNDFLASAGGRLETAPYKLNANVGDSNYTYFIDGDADKFSVPTILLVDFTKEAFELNDPRIGVSEVTFGVSGEDKFAKAQVIANMWNHTTKTNNTNPFSDVYNNKSK